MVKQTIKAKIISFWPLRCESFGSYFDKNVSSRSSDWGVPCDNFYPCYRDLRAGFFTVPEFSQPWRLSSLGQVQTPYITWAESNANEGEQRIFLICIRFGSCEVRRLNLALDIFDRLAALIFVVKILMCFYEKSGWSTELTSCRFLPSFVWVWHLHIEYKVDMF